MMLARGRISLLCATDDAQSPKEVIVGQCDAAVSEAHVFSAGFCSGLRLRKHSCIGKEVFSFFSSFTQSLL